MQSRLIFSLISKPIIVISFILLATVWICSGCGRKEEAEGFVDTGYEQEMRGTPDETSGLDGTSEEAEAPSSVCVFVCGAVAHEGVYRLKEGARLIDAVNAAGGFSKDADRTYINLAEYVYDTQRIEVPTLEEAQSMRDEGRSDQGAPGRSDGISADGRVNINHAGKEDLMTLPGIGESKADRIIAYRQAHGDFTACEEVMNVNGIGEAMYENIKDYITVD